MATSAANGKALLGAVRQMNREEFDAFLAEALSLRAQSTGATLSPEETKLIRRINRGLPVKWQRRYAQLAERRKRGSLTAVEHQKLLQLTHEAESRDAERAAALVKLAKLRHLPVRVLMKQRASLLSRPIARRRIGVRELVLPRAVASIAEGGPKRQVMTW
jgi:hypothetical protein